MEKDCIERLKKVAGQNYDDPKCRVRNPNITARESIEIGNHIVILEEALKQFIRAYPYNPPCYDWKNKAMAHNLARKALMNSQD